MTGHTVCTLVFHATFFFSGAINAKGQAFTPICQKFPFISQIKIRTTTAILRLNLLLYGFSAVTGCILHLCQNKMQERQNWETKLTTQSPSIEGERSSSLPQCKTLTPFTYLPGRLGRIPTQYSQSNKS